MSSLASRVKWKSYETPQSSPPPWSVRASEDKSLSQTAQTLWIYDPKNNSQDEKRPISILTTDRLIRDRRSSVDFGSGSRLALKVFEPRGYVSRQIKYVVASLNMMVFHVQRTAFCEGPGDHSKFGLQSIKSLDLIDSCSISSLAIRHESFLHSLLRSPFCLVRGGPAGKQ